MLHVEACECRLFDHLWQVLTIPRKVPAALANHVEQNNLQGKLKYNLFVGASAGSETENRWARNNMIERRSPHQVGKEIAKGINNGNIKFFDKHLSMFPVDLMYGYYTKHKKENRLDVAIVEATAITEDGGIIPGASVSSRAPTRCILFICSSQLGRRVRIPYILDSCKTRYLLFRIPRAEHWHPGRCEPRDHSDG